MSSKLPAMPPNYHGWWKNAKVERIELKEQRPCDHTKSNGETAFKITQDGAKCMKCNLGFLGTGFEILNGKLCNSNSSAH